MFIINFHSFSDLITNSSTDIFACKTDKTNQMINELLSELYCISKGLKNLLIEDKIKYFNNEVATVEMGTVKNFIDRCEYYLLYEWDSEGNQQKTNTPNTIIEKNYFFNKLKLDDEIIIVCGVSSNTIPYWMQNFIEENLNAYRVHMG